MTKDNARQRLQQKIRNQSEKKLEFWQAAERGDLSTIEQLLNQADEKTKKAFFEYCPERMDFPALLIAISNQHTEVAKFLIDQRIDVDKRIGDLTPIILAILRQNYDIVLHLLNAGADPNQIIPNDSSSKSNYNILGLALSSKNKEIASRIALLLIKSGANVNTKASEYSPLVIALSMNLQDVYQAIIKKGTNLEDHLLFFLTQYNKQAFDLLIENIPNDEHKPRLLLKIIAASLEKIDKQKIIILIQNESIFELINKTDDGKLLIAKAVFKLGLSMKGFLDKFTFKPNQIVEVIRYIFTDKPHAQIDNLNINLNVSLQFLLLYSTNFVDDFYKCISKRSIDFLVNFAITNQKNPLFEQCFLDLFNQAIKFKNADVIEKILEQIPEEIVIENIKDLKELFEEKSGLVKDKINALEKQEKERIITQEKERSKIETLKDELENLKSSLSYFICQGQENILAEESSENLEHLQQRVHDITHNIQQLYFKAKSKSFAPEKIDPVLKEVKKLGNDLSNFVAAKIKNIETQILQCESKQELEAMVKDCQNLLLDAQILESQITSLKTDVNLLLPRKNIGVIGSVSPRDAKSIFIPSISDETLQSVYEEFKDEEQLKIKGHIPHGHQIEKHRCKDYRHSCLLTQLTTQFEELESKLPGFPKNISQDLIDKVLIFMSKQMVFRTTGSGGSHCLEAKVPKIFPSQDQEVSNPNEQQKYLSFWLELSEKVAINSQSAIKVENFR